MRPPCALDRLSGHKLFLRTQKTGVPGLYPATAVCAGSARCLPAEERSVLVLVRCGIEGDGDWQLAPHLSACPIAGVKGGHPHRFRDTLAVELLREGVPMERVSILLGHSSVKITERQYAPWVQARQAQLEDDLERVLAEESSGTDRHAAPRHGDPGYAPANGSDISATQKGRGR